MTETIRTRGEHLGVRHASHATDGGDLSRTTRWCQHVSVAESSQQSSPNKGLVPYLLRDLRLLTSGLLLSGFVISATWRVVTASRSDDPWNTGDWLIDYSSGFVRRGLFGSLIGIISWSPASATTMVVGTQLALILFVTTFVIANVMRAPASMAMVAVALSPSFLLFGVMDPGGSFRKEWLGLVALTALLIAVEPTIGKRVRRLTILTCCLVFVLASFSHEANVLLLPALLLVLHRADLTRGEQLWTTFALVTSAVVAGLTAVFFAGSPEVAGAQCESLVFRGFEPTICAGAIEWLGRTQGSILYEGEYLFVSALPLLLPLAAFSCAPLALFKWTRSQALGLLIVGATIAIPLSVVSLDHGRWLRFAIAACTLLALPSIRRNEVLRLDIPGVLVLVLAFSWRFTQVPTLEQLPALNQWIQTVSDILG